MTDFDSSRVRSVPELFRANARQMNQKTAIIYMGRKISYSKLAVLASNVGSFLKASTGPDDRVAIWMPNIPQFIISYYGTLMAGRIAVPINFISIANELKSKPTRDIKVTPEIAAQIADSKPSVIVIADMFYPILKQIRIDWPCKVITTGVHDFFPFLLRLLYPLKARKDGKWFSAPKNILRLKRVMRINIPCPEEYPDLDQVAQLQYTGGTTGVPKGAVLTHRCVVSNVFQAIQALPNLLKPEEEVVVAALPLFHAYGGTVCMNVTILGLRGRLLLVPAFVPKDVIRQMAKHKATIFPGVNRMYQTLLAQRKQLAQTPLSSLKLCISGAGPVDKEIIDTFSELTGATVVEGYGLSETSPILSVARPEDMAAKKKPGVNLLGRPVPGTEMKVVGEDGRDLPQGENGEIIARGPQVMAGYYNKPEDSAAVLKNGWFFTGDIGYADADGCFYLTDRKKELIKVMGENIYASHIERALRRHPEVVEACAIGVPDPKRGETPVACVVLKTPVAEPYTDIITFMRNDPEVTPYQVPSRVFIFESFDAFKNPIGKLLKRKLKEEVLSQT